MKKENKKMAQQKRAEERRKREAAAKRNKILSIVVPVAVVVILIVVIIIGTVQPYNKSSDEASEETTEAAALVLSDDTSLTVEDGDTVNIDYVGSIDGVEFSGGSTNGNGTDLVIGSGTYIDNFEEQLIGAHPGDTVDVNVTFPENYGNEDLNGQDALFVVTVNGIYE